MVAEEGEVERMEAGECLPRRVSPRPNEGLVDWLLACPEKDYFVPTGRCLEAG